MFKKIKERNIHFLIIAFLTGMFFGINFSFQALAKETTHKYLDYFHNVYQIIFREYVDTPSPKKMFYGAIRGMIKSLGDPYSRFLDENAYKQLREMTTGKFVGVGIEITEKRGRVVIITPIEDSPAMDAGVKAGDIIMKINDIDIKNKSLSNVVKLIKGLPGSKVTLHVKREGMDELIEFELERKPIKIKSVKYAVIGEHNTGYIKLMSFGSDTGKDVARALKSFNKKNIDKVIVDMRYNPGGLLTAAIEISDLFLDKGARIVSTKGRSGVRKERIFNATSDKLYTGKVLLLVNRGSASASEILSGALRDNKRASLLGEKTFGKGSVQKSFTLDKNIGVAITIAKYYTPSGELIHKKGIKPDFPVKADTISDEDRKSLMVIHKKKLLDQFVNKNTEYNEETKERFLQFLADQKITVTKKSAFYILKNRIRRFKKQDLYDLEFDNQLVSAIRKINE